MAQHNPPKKKCPRYSSRGRPQKDIPYALEEFSMNCPTAVEYHFDLDLSCRWVFFPRLKLVGMEQRGFHFPLETLNVVHKQNAGSGSHKCTLHKEEPLGDVFL